MDSLFERLGDTTGASVDQIKLIFCLLVSYPLGSLYVRLPHSQPALKHLFSVVVSGFFLLRVLNLWFGALQLLGSVFGTYLLTSLLSGRYMPWIVFVFVMGHLTFNHVYRAMYEIPFETFEITGPQMVLTMKLTTFAWNVWDGRRPVEELDKWQLKHRVVSMPSLLEFLGYSFYFPGTLVGPYTEYATYASLIDGSLFTGHQTAYGKRVPEGRKRVAYTRMFMGLGFLGFFVAFGAEYTYQTVLSSTWLQKGFLHRFFLVQVFGFVARTKYYAVWMLTEGASILTGLGFTGFTPAAGTTRWDGAANVNFLSLEWPSNPKMIFDSWNMKTNVWLRECMYKRVARQGRKPGFKSSMTTFITSAFWHGIAGGYYLSFLIAGFLPAVGRLCRTYIRPLLLPPALSSTSTPSRPLTGPKENLRKPEAFPEPPRTIARTIYDFAGSAISIVTLNFAAAPFVLGDFKDSIEAWRRMDWYGLWILGGAMLFFSIGGKSWLRSVAQKRVRRAEKRREEETKGVKVCPTNGIDIRTPGPHIVPPVDLAVEKLT